MSDLSDGDFDHDYDPSQEDSDDSEVSCESEVSSGSDDDVDEGVKPIIDEGWSYLSDSFSDARPTHRPLFLGACEDTDPGNLTTETCPSFTLPKDAFMHIFDNDVVLCNVYVDEFEGR